MSRDSRVCRGRQKDHRCAGHAAMRAAPARRSRVPYRCVRWRAILAPRSESGSSPGEHIQNAPKRIRVNIAIDLLVHNQPLRAISTPSRR